MSQIGKLLQRCRESDSSLLWVLITGAWHRLSGKNLLTSQRVRIRGLKNVRTNGLVHIGLSSIGFMHKYDRTFLNVQGTLEFRDKYSIGKGCRFDIGSGATASFGKGHISANSTFIIMHSLRVGDDCAISWGCQFLDEDFHEISFEGKRNKQEGIAIGDHVWVGSNATILKGSRIPDGCVVAAGSVVTKVFEQKNCLIGGNPAKVIRENVSWK